MEHILSAATVGETADVANNVCAAITKAAIEDDYLNNENASLKANAEEMIKGIGTIRSKELTASIEAADLIRDNLLSALIHFLKGFLLWDKEDTSAAAKLLMQTIKSHGGNFSRLGNERQSAAYDSLLNEFEKEESVSAFVTLGLSQLFTDMKDAENNFKSLFRQAAEIESAKTTIIAPSLIKRETQIKLNDIIIYLETMSKAKAGIYGTLAANVEELVNAVNTKIRIRITSK